MQPDEGMTIRFGSKVPGTAMEIRDVNMDFAYGGSFTEASPEAYERLILDVLLGDPPLFPRHEEVELSWKILDPIIEHWASKGKPEQYASGTWGPSPPTTDAGPRRTHLEAAVNAVPSPAGRTLMIELPTPTPPAIAAESASGPAPAPARPAMGMVLTLVIVVDEDERPPRWPGRAGASHEHPARVLGVILGDGRGAARINAQVGTGQGWSGETALIRLHGEVVRHAESVVLPLLLPDSPVAVWWPTDAPGDPAGDPLGALGTAPDHRRRRRRTGQDQGDAHPVRGLRAGQHRPGLDPAHPLAGAARRGPRPAPAQGPVGDGHGRADQPQRRPAGGLAARPAQGHRARASHGPGITEVVLDTDEGDIRVSRPAGRLATFSSPGQPDRPVALPRRSLPELLGEELRRLDEDEVYAAAAQQPGRGRDRAGRRPAKRYREEVGVEADHKRSASRSARRGRPARRRRRRGRRTSPPRCSSGWPRRSPKAAYPRSR